MGHGIALVFAAGGHDVRDHRSGARGSRRRVTERIARHLAEPRARTDGGARRAITGRRQTSPRPWRDADVVIEAAPEKLRAEAGRSSPSSRRRRRRSALLCSNTSVIPIGQIAARLTSRHRVLGTHWWNPPYLVPLVEVIQRRRHRSPRTVDAMMALLDAARQDAGACRRRTCRASSATACSTRCGARRSRWWPRASATPRRSTLVVKSSFGRRLAVLGPLENADLVGTDLTLDIHNDVLADLDRQPGPSPYLRCAGRATASSASNPGEGFATWTRGREEPRSGSASLDHLKRMRRTDLADIGRTTCQSPRMHIAATTAASSS